MAEGQGTGQGTEDRTGNITSVIDEAQASENKTQTVLKKISKQECEVQSFLTS